MNKQETFMCLRDTLTQDKQLALDKLTAKFGIENIFQRVVGKDEVNTVCYQCPDTYIEVVFSDNKLQSLHGDERLLLDDIGNALEKIMECTLCLTSLHTSWITDLRYIRWDITHYPRSII